MTNGEAMREALRNLPVQEVGAGNSTWDDCEPTKYVLLSDLNAALAQPVQAEVGAHDVCFAIAALEPSTDWLGDYVDGFLAAKNEALKLVEAALRSAAGTGGASATEKELRELRAWKQSAIAVMPDYQRIGKLLGVPLGESVHDKIVPALEALASRRGPEKK